MVGMKDLWLKIVTSWTVDKTEVVKHVCALPVIAIFTLVIALLGIQIGALVDHFFHFPQWVTFVVEIGVGLTWFLLDKLFGVPAPTDMLNEWILDRMSTRDHIIFSGVTVSLAAVCLTWAYKQHHLQAIWHNLMQDETDSLDGIKEPSK